MTPKEFSDKARKEIKEALKTFGTYSYDDKGPDEETWLDRDGRKVRVGDVVIFRETPHAELLTIIPPESALTNMSESIESITRHRCTVMLSNRKKGWSCPASSTGGAWWVAPDEISLIPREIVSAGQDAVKLHLALQGIEINEDEEEAG